MTKRKLPERNDSGFVALITAIIISAILLTVAVAMNQVGYLTRGEVLDSEYKNRSAALAEACGDLALLNIAQDANVTGSVPVGADTCSIDSVQADEGTGLTTITTSAEFPAAAVLGRGAVTKLQIVVDSDDLTIQSWNEIP